MNGAMLQAKLYASYASAAARIGLNADQYRATSSSNPLAPANKLRSMAASFNAQDMFYAKPAGYGDASWYGVFDGRLTQPGDYLVATSGTWFIAAQQQALPMLCVQCTNSVDIKRPQGQTGVGALPYGGDIDANETLLMGQWPCSILHKGGGAPGEGILPGDAKSAQWQVLLPAYAGVTLRYGDIISDNQARRMTVASAELTPLGWRLIAQEAET
jgi:hypothetical protein